VDIIQLKQVSEYIPVTFRYSALIHFKPSWRRQTFFGCLNFKGTKMF